MNKGFLLSLAILLFAFFVHRVPAQNICNPAGNLIIYSNYDGGVLNINVDVNIPNIKVGIVTYEPVTINLSGAFVGNVTEVRYAGYVSTNNNHCSNSPTTTTIAGVNPAITSVNFLPPATLSNPNGYSSIVCNYSCNTASNQGGCNTADQIAHYFATTMGGTMRFHFTQYGCWSLNPFLMSAGGNCCAGAAPPSAFAGNDTIICPGDFFTLNGTGGGNCSWSPATYLSNQNICNPVCTPLTNITYVLSVVNGSVTTRDTLVVNVFPAPNCLSLPEYVCHGDSALFQSSMGTCDIDSAWGPGVSNFVFRSQLAGYGTHIVHYRSHSFATGCSAITVDTIIVPNPIVTTVLQSYACENDSPFTISGMPAWGTWFGTGISNERFDPAISGVGTFNPGFTALDSVTGCRDTSYSAVTILPRPATPVITPVGPDSLQSSVQGQNYIWLLNGSDTGDSTRTIFAAGSGSYRLVVLGNNNCYSDTSAPFIWTIVAFDDEVSFSVFPNPALDFCTIKTDNCFGSINISLSDFTGRIIFSAAEKCRGDFKINFKVNGLPEGVYCVQIQTDKGRIARKLVITKD